MNKKEWQRRMAYEALILLALLALLLFITRLWPILLLVILGIFIATLRLLFLSPRKVEPTQPTPLLPAPVPTDLETDLKTHGYSNVLRQITEHVLAAYPDARWIWESPSAKRQIESGEPVFILLNRAGGYRKAQVLITNYQVSGLSYLEAQAQPVASGSPETSESDTEEYASDPLPENYELLAFEWVDSNILRLNSEINEAIGMGKTDHVIPASSLPVPESWENIRKELARNGLENTHTAEDGIHIIIEQ